MKVFVAPEAADAATNEPVPAVLVVDDRQANLTALEATLAAPGVRIVTADSGERALELASGTEFAVILLDVRMPGLSGHGTIQRLRQQERSRHTPVIMLTASDGDEQDVLSAYAQGAVDYLMKPYRLEVLRAKVRTFLELFRQREHLRQQEAALQGRLRDLERHWFFETLESLSDGFLAFDAEWRFTHLNAVGERVLGRPRAELIGRDLWTEFPELESTVFGRAYRKAMGEQVPVQVEEFYPPFDTWFEARAFPTRSGLSIFFRDISERKRHEQERARLLANEQATRLLVEEQKALLERIVDQSANGIIVATGGGELRIFNPAAVEQHGMPPLGEGAAEWSSMHRPRTPDGEDIPLEATPLMRALNGESVLDACWQVQRSDGSWRTLQGSATPLRAADGHRTGALMVTRDVTIERRAQRELRDSEAQFRTLAESIPHLAWMSTADGAASWFNQRWYEYTGTDLKETAGWGWKSVQHARFVDGIVDRWTSSVSSGEPFELEMPLRRHDGVFRWHLTRAAPVRDADGRVVRWFGTHTDIDDQRNARERQRFLAEASKTLAGSGHYEATLRAVARLAVPVFADWAAVHMLDERGRIQTLAVEHSDPAKGGAARELNELYPPDINDVNGVGRVLRTGAAELAVDIPDSLLVASSRSPEHLRRARELGLRSYLCVPIKSGESVLGTISLVFAESGRRYETIDLQVVEELASRAALAIENARANRAKDEFLAMLGHELRNPLAPIVTALDLMRAQQNSDFERERTVIERQVKHLMRLVDDLLDVSRIARAKVTLELERLELHDIVTSALELVSPLIEERAHRLAVEVPRIGLPVHGDSGRLTQVAANLLTNAAKYTPPRGCIRLLGGLEGEMVVLRVQDDGMGISADVLPQIFELFVQGRQTLERSLGGLGLGLTIVRSLVEQHGGAVTAHSAGADQGSEFVVQLPRAKPGAQNASATRNPPAQGGSGRLAEIQLLLVDDNVDAAEMLGAVLQSRGCIVQVAHDAAAALQLAATQHFDAAVLDIGLPVMDGYELAARLRALDTMRGALLIALTGYGQASDRERALAAGFDHHTVKPVDLRELENLLRRAGGPAHP
jgi:PAS domain S-box-containing protein